jgi:hypothetical protein
MAGTPMEEEILAEIYQHIREQHNALGDLGYLGFRILQSPLHVNPALAIIGHQVGGRRRDMVEDQHWGPPPDHDYFVADNPHNQRAGNYPLARRMRLLFGDGERAERFNAAAGNRHPPVRIEPSAPLLDVLQHSVILDLIFFRAPRIANWVQLFRDANLLVMRQQIEGECAACVEQLLNEVVRPIKVVSIGFHTFGRLADPGVPVVTDGEPGMRSVTLRSTHGGRQLLGLRHVTGSHLTRAELTRMREAVEEFVFE